MQRFMFWARVMAENAVLRHIWLALRELGGLRQSQVLHNLSDWIDATDDPAAEPLRAVLARSLAAPSELGKALGYLFGVGDRGVRPERRARHRVRYARAPRVSPITPADGGLVA